MNDGDLMRLALLWGLFGLFLLLIVSELTEPERIDIFEVQNRVGRTVIIEGNISRASHTPDISIFNVKDETAEIKVVVFEETNKRLAKGDSIRVVGEVDIYKGELEIKAEKIECLKCSS